MCDRSTVSNLNHKINAIEMETVLLREELTVANNNLVQQQHENLTLRTENNALLDGHRRQMQVHQCVCYCLITLLSPSTVTCTLLVHFFCSSLSTALRQTSFYEVMLRLWFWAVNYSFKVLSCLIKVLFFLYNFLIFLYEFYYI